MNEAETRAEHTDPALKATGWGVVEGSRIRREYLISPGRIEGRGRHGKPLIADYVLEYCNTKLAVNEAKAWDEELTEGVAQAKNYAGKLAVRHTYATNGQGIYAIDMLTGKEGEIAAYPRPDELWAMTFPSTRSGTGDAADKASEQVHINSQFNAKQQAFLDFVLSHYVTVGVEELDQNKLTPLLRLKYHDSIADAVADLGKPDETGKVFAGFQRYLYANAG